MDFKSIYKCQLNLKRVLIKTDPPYEVQQLGFTKHITLTLIRAGIIDFEQIKQLTFGDFLSINSFGNKTLKNLWTVLQNEPSDNQSKKNKDTVPSKDLQFLSPTIVQNLNH